MNTPQLVTFVLSLSITHIACANNQALPDPKKTEIWEPEPQVVSTFNNVPSDAISLFNGQNLSEWQHGDGTEVQWPIVGNAFTIKPGTKGIKTKQQFCDMQLHIEWRSPTIDANKSGQHLGNSGIFLQGRYEIQVLNSYQNRTYSNGQAGSIYKQSAPLVNASRPPLEWQTYDIIFTAPKYDSQGQLTQKAHVTVLHNGVLIQNHTEIQGSTRYRGLPEYPSAYECGPIHLQDHGSKVSYRNIWVRQL